MYYFVFLQFMSNLGYSNIPNLGKKTQKTARKVCDPERCKNTQAKAINNAEELCCTESYQQKNSFPCFPAQHSKSYDLENIGYFSSALKAACSS